MAEYVVEMSREQFEMVELALRERIGHALHEACLAHTYPNSQSKSDLDRLDVAYEQAVAVYQQIITPINGFHPIVES